MGVGGRRQEFKNGRKDGRVEGRAEAKAQGREDATCAYVLYLATSNEKSNDG